MDGDGGSRDGGAKEWLLIDGNRFVVAGAMAVAAFVVIYGLSRLGWITLGTSSNVRTLLSSGIASGMLTLVTVTLSINQLLLSRMFGSVNDLTDRLDGSEGFRDRVRELTGRHSTPTHPAEFLSLIVTSIRERGDRLEDDVDQGLMDDFEPYLDELDGYARNVLEAVEDDTRAGKSSTAEVLSSILGPEYAENLRRTRHLQNQHGEALSDRTESDLNEVRDLLEAIAVLRQFFKTLAIQQDLARLSRLIAYSGFGALLTTFALATVYKASSGAVIPSAWLPLVTSAGIAVIVLPLALLISYMLRVATISRYSVSVGSFVPPEEQFSN